MTDTLDTDWLRHLLDQHPQRYIAGYGNTSAQALVPLLFRTDVRELADPFVVMQLANAVDPLLRRLDYAERVVTALRAQLDGGMGSILYQGDGERYDLRDVFDAMSGYEVAALREWQEKPPNPDVAEVDP